MTPYQWRYASLLFIMGVIVCVVIACAATGGRM